MTTRPTIVGGGSFGPKLLWAVHLCGLVADTPNMRFPLRLRRPRPEDAPARSRDRRSQRERGAAMVEFALVSPLFFLILFGGIELGLIFRGNLAVEDMTRSAARVASIVRDDPEADRAILTEIDSRTSSLNGEILNVIIFSGDTLDSEMPPGCISGAGGPVSISNVCNSYSASDVADIAAGGGVLGTALKDTEREQWDIIGITVQYRQDSITGIIDGVTLNSTTVEVIELDL